ncbi:MAG TPA: RNase A-like domain-containing protein [Terriglobales bacterium]|nr:RNase A-like domain-containing protein [Terriglobales bacterium]
MRVRALRLLFLFVLAAMDLVCFSGCRQAAPPANTPESRAEPRVFPSPAPGGSRYDLAKDEARGGHTLSKHVGRTDDELRERLLRERNITAASTWTDRPTAEYVIGEALRAERGRLESWMRRGYPRANLALHYDAGRPIGRSLRRGEDQVVDATQAVIVLRADGPDSFYVLTAYPEARE